MEFGWISPPRAVGSAARRGFAWGSHLAACANRACERGYCASPGRAGLSTRNAPRGRGGFSLLPLYAARVGCRKVAVKWSMRIPAGLVHAAGVCMGHPVPGAHHFPWFGVYIARNSGGGWLANLFYFGISRNRIAPRAIFWYHQNRALTAARMVPGFAR